MCSWLLVLSVSVSLRWTGDLSVVEPLLLSDDLWGPRDLTRISGIDNEWMDPYDILLLLC